MNGEQVIRTGDTEPNRPVDLHKSRQHSGRRHCNLTDSVKSMFKSHSNDKISTVCLCHQQEPVLWDFEIREVGK